MTPTHLSGALLLLTPIALGAAPYLGTPWPGVVLAGLSLLPHGLEALLALRRTDDAVKRLETQNTAILMRLEEVEGDVRAMKSRKALGG